jgi:hypothetical protein
MAAIPPPATLSPLIGDLAWLYHQDRFGIFKLIFALTDDYRYRGRHPILPNNPSVTLLLERIIRDMDTEAWPKPKDRNSTYLRALGWSLREDKSLANVQINHSFAKYFHRFIQLAVLYYSEKQVAVAIRGTARTQAPPSFATEAAIRDTLILLIESLDRFTYGRNQRNTLIGLRSVAIGASAIRILSNAIGIPNTLFSPEDYIPAAYDILVLRQGISAATKSKYLIHLDLSSSSQTLLNQITAFTGIDLSQNVAGTNRTILSLWLDNVESIIEKYRTAYKAATGTDLRKLTAATLQELPQLRSS